MDTFEDCCYSDLVTRYNKLKSAYELAVQDQIETMDVLIGVEAGNERLRAENKEKDNEINVLSSEKQELFDALAEINEARNCSRETPYEYCEEQSYSNLEHYDGHPHAIDKILKDILEKYKE